MRRTSSDNGIVRPQEVAKHIDLGRYPPDPDLGRFVERYWTVHWDLRDRDPYQVRVISHPCVNVTFTEVQGAEIHGVGTTTSSHPLAGVGRVFGIKFRPGGFFSYATEARGLVRGAIPASEITDRSVPMRELFGPAADELADTVLRSSDDHAIALVADFLLRRMPVDGALRDETYDFLLHVVATMLDDRTITRVDQVAKRFGISLRTLQRIFRTYVGVSPKWMIRRYRLHDGAARLASDANVDPSALAVELGWFDQAHFTRDFTKLIGTSPAEYAAACAAEGDREPMAVL